MLVLCGVMSRAVSANVLSVGVLQFLLIPRTVGETRGKAVVTCFCDTTREARTGHFLKA